MQNIVRELIWDDMDIISHKESIAASFADERKISTSSEKILHKVCSKFYMEPATYYWVEKVSELSNKEYFLDSYVEALNAANKSMCWSRLSEKNFSIEVALRREGMDLERFCIWVKDEFDKLGIE